MPFEQHMLLAEPLEPGLGRGIFSDQIHAPSIERCRQHLLEHGKIRRGKSVEDGVGAKCDIGPRSASERPRDLAEDVEDSLKAGVAAAPIVLPCRELAFTKAREQGEMMDMERLDAALGQLQLECEKLT